MAGKENKLGNNLCKIIGNLPNKSVITIIGPIGSKKELIAYMAMCDNIKNNVISYYLYHGRTNGEVEGELKNYGIDIKKAVKNKKIYWFDASNLSEGDNVINCNIDNLFTISLALREFLILNKNKNIFGIIDILSPAIMMNDKAIIYRFAEDMINALKQYNTKTIILLEEEMHDNEILSAIEHLSDCVIEMSVKEEKFKVINLLRFKKLRGIVAPDKRFKLSITNKAATIS